MEKPSSVILGGSRTNSGFDNLFPTNENWQFLTEEKLIVCHRDGDNELRFYIPIQDVAGIRKIDISQPIYDDNPFNDDYDHLLMEYLSHFSEDERPLRVAIRKRRQAESKRAWARFIREMESRFQNSSAASFEGPPQRSLVEDELEYIELYTVDRRLEPLLRAAALRTAQRHGYQVDRWSLGILGNLRSTVVFVGDFEPKPGERLYVDWEYVSRNREGINSAGFGFVVSLSLSWNSSEARAAKRLAKKPITGLSDVCRETLTLVRGHVAFLEMPGSTIGRNKISSGLKLSMDGGTWKAAIICMHPIVKAPDADTPWVLSYWMEGRDEVPFEMLDTSAVPLEIFASVHSGRSTTSFGTANCFLKVHYAQAARS